MFSHNLTCFAGLHTWLSIQPQTDQADLENRAANLPTFLHQMTCAIKQMMDLMREAWNRRAFLWSVSVNLKEPHQHRSTDPRRIRSFDQAQLPGPLFYRRDLAE